MKSEKKRPMTWGAGTVLLFEDKVLLVQMNYGSFRGHWILPGGLIKSGETIFDGAKREFLEETGLKIKVERPLAARFRHRDFELVDLYFALLGSFEERPPSHPLKWHPEEIIEAKWWPVKEALKDACVRPASQIYLALAMDPPDEVKRLESPPTADYQDLLFTLV
jgi:8-oxo-dGTP pyrophosphatase MutT (NUDIX family)